MADYGRKRRLKKKENKRSAWSLSEIQLNTCGRCVNPFQAGKLHKLKELDSEKPGNQNLGVMTWSPGKRE